MFGTGYGRRARRSPRVGRNGQAVALMLMLVRQVQQLDRKPPVTLGLMGTNCRFWASFLIIDTRSCCFVDSALMCSLHFQLNESSEFVASYRL